MLRSSFFNDPFFGDEPNDPMRQMDQMFNNGFGMMGGGNRMALPGGGRQNRQNGNDRQVAQQGMVMDPFAHFQNMFSNMHSMMADMRGAFDGSQPNSNSQVFHQSSVMSYSNTGSGAPRVYQASSSSHQGPGGIRETRKTVRDSETGIDRIAVGHHIRDRGHVIERSRNNQTGHADENQEFINLEEEEAPSFDHEYREKWHSTMRGVDQRRHAERARHAPVAGGYRRHQAALPEPEGHRRHQAALPETETRRPYRSNQRRE